MMSEWGFDFVRLPLDYRCWTNAKNPCKFDEQVLGEIDQAVEFGRKHGIHVCLNLHRAPGYCVGSPSESFASGPTTRLRSNSISSGRRSRGYRGIPSTRLSFNLVNEPGVILPQTYCRVVRRVVAAIRREDPPG